MLAGYKNLNQKAKIYLTKEVQKKIFEKFKSEDLLKRCEKELNLLYEKKLLFVIEYLYRFKNEDISISNHVLYHFRGMINNLLLLYVLDLSYVNPLEYNLPYELFNDNTIDVDLINEIGLGLIYYLDSQTEYFKIIKGFYKKENSKKINKLLENHYLLLPCKNLDKDMLLRFNNQKILETIDDYRNYKDKYITIRIGEKYCIDFAKVCLDNVITNDFEKKIAKLLKPKTINDFIKIKSIANGVKVWNCNQDILIKEKKIDINNLITNCEDILEYLLNHSIEKDKAIEITTFICKGYPVKNSLKWDKYVKLMKKNNCEDMFIEIFSKILFLGGRGQAVSECLFVQDKNNYLDL